VRFPEEGPLIEEVGSPSTTPEEADPKPRKPWPARHKLLTGLGVVVVAGRIAAGIGLGMQRGDSDTAVMAAALSGDSAEDAR
jgi:hypothetical protein